MNLHETLQVYDTYAKMLTWDKCLEGSHSLYNGVRIHSYTEPANKSNILLRYYCIKKNGEQEKPTVTHTHCRIPSNWYPFDSDYVTCYPYLDLAYLLMVVDSRST